MAIAIRKCKICGKTFDATIGIDKSLFCSECKDTVDYKDKESDVLIPEGQDFDVYAPNDDYDYNGDTGDSGDNAKSLTDIEIPDDLLLFINGLDVKPQQPVRVLDDFRNSKHRR